MQLIRELSECIDVNIRCARNNARLAEKLRTENENISRILFQTSKQDKENICKLLDSLVQMVSDGMPKEYENLYTYLIEKYSDEIKKINIEPTE